jgi:hypothetical protein
VDSTELVAYGLLGTGLAIGFVAGLMAMARRINQKPANAALLRLVKAGELERVVKLCRAAPRTFFAAVSAGTVAAIEARTDDSLRVLIAAQDAFDAAGKQLAARWRSVMNRGLFGVLVGASGAAVALSSGAQPSLPTIAMSGGVALLALYFVGRRGECVHQLATARREVLPEIVKLAVSRATPEPTKPAPRPKLELPKLELPKPPGSQTSPPALSPVAPLFEPAPLPGDRHAKRCPSCEQPLKRADTAYVCERCGFTQELAGT